MIQKAFSTQNTRMAAFAAPFLALVLAVTGLVVPQRDAGRMAADATPEAATVQVETPKAPVARTIEPTAAPAPAPAAAIPAPAAEPAEDTGKSLGVGTASYYGPGFAGRPTANGETFDPSEMTAAHKTLPFGTRVRVTNQNNGKSVVVRINDRGPFVAHRVIDVSEGAAQRLGMKSSGTARVELEVLS